MSSTANGKRTPSTLTANLRWAVGCVAIVGTPLHAQPTIANLGTLPGGNASYDEDISANGLVVTGTSNGPAVPHAFRWTIGTGMQDLGILAGGNYSTGTGLSADGAVITGISGAITNASRAFRWTAGSGMQSIGVLGSGLGSAGNAISSDGSVIAGYSSTDGVNGGRAFRWTAASGMQNLGILNGGHFSNAFAISADGSTVIGAGDNATFFQRAFRWTAGGGLQDLGVLPGADESFARAVSADGLTVAGHSANGLNNTGRAFRWNAAGGMQDLGVMNDGDYSQAFAISGNGSVVVGTCNSTRGDRAFVWTSALGMMDLNEYLSSLGANLTGWSLHYATGVSADGGSIVGQGTFNGADRAFLVRGPTTWPSCSPHWSASAGVPGLTFAGSSESTGYAITWWDADGAGPAPGVVVVGGAFSAAGGVPANNIATWNPESGAWTSLGSGTDSRVLTVLSVPNEVGGNDLIAGGDFSAAGGMTVNSIARWNGSAWSSLGTGMAGAPGLIRVGSLAILPGGDLVAGGIFTIAGNTPASYVARWDGQAWSALGSGIGGEAGVTAVRALAVLPSGDLVAGGSFTEAGGVAANGIARWSGTSWSTLASGVMPAAVEALAVTPEGELIAGGRFSSAGGVAVNRIARWNGTGWSSLGSGVESEVIALAIRTNGDVIAGGNSFTAGGVAAKTIARWNGVIWSALGTGAAGTPNTAFTPIVQGVTILPSGEVAMVGDFTSQGGVSASDIAVYSFGTPQILMQPQRVVACGLGDANFTVGVRAGPVVFQWEKDGAAIDSVANPSAATATLALSGVGVDDDAIYRCVVSNACGSEITQGASLTVCIADFNCSGDVGVQDIFDFINAFFANEPRADVDASGVVSVQDIFTYLDAYFAGCA